MLAASQAISSHLGAMGEEVVEHHTADPCRRCVRRIGREVYGAHAIGEAKADPLLAIARSADRRIDGDDERLVAGSFGAVDEVERHGTLGVEVELEPPPRPRNGGHILERRAGQRADDDAGVLRRRRNRRAALAVGMGQALMRDPVR